MKRNMLRLTLAMLLLAVSLSGCMTWERFEIGLQKTVEEAVTGKNPDATNETVQAATNGIAK